MTTEVAQPTSTSRPTAVQGRPIPNVAADVVAVALPPVAISSGMVLAFNLLRGILGVPITLRIARFVNLLLASLLVGNGLGAMFAIHPALRSLPPRGFFEAERAISPRYGSIMRMLMPAAVVSCINILRLMKNRRSAAFGLTTAGTASLAGVVVTTMIELPLNIQTMRTEPDRQLSDWVASRDRWDRFNLIRNLFAVAGWVFLCLAALAERRD